MKRELAIALGYEPDEDAAPRVVAAGAGEWAERLRLIAEKNGVPVQEDGDLAELLSGIPVDDEIPPELYPAIAEIFVFLHRIAVDLRGEVVKREEPRNDPGA